jgi:hypothetical protein
VVARFPTNTGGLSGWALSLVLIAPVAARAQTRAAPASDVPTLAIVNVNVVSLQSQRIEPQRTVLIAGDRITAIAAAGAAVVPPGATIVDGTGRYLLPGLTDAHVHLTTDRPWAPTRPDFGDAPLYLSHGVTTVINLRGTPEQLVWRHRINAGELLGPTIYSAGGFINEPRVTTPEDVTREIDEQCHAGYDLIKFHEVWTPDEGYVTTTGLSQPTYEAMIRAARERGMPLVGHAPVNLDIDVLLAVRQPLAHVGELSRMYFMPMQRYRQRLLLGAVALSVLTVVIAAWAGATLVGRRRRTPIAWRRWSRAETLVGITWGGAILAVLCALLCLPVGPLFESLALRVGFTALSLVVAVGAIAHTFLTLSAAAALRPRARGAQALLSLAAIIVGATLATFVPVVWRSSDRGIARLAQRLATGGIPVMTTLVNYEFLGPEQDVLIQDPMTAYLSPRVQERWKAMATGEIPSYRYYRFTRKVTAALHRAGVPLIAGTDAMGLPSITPGSSLHRELELLVASGLSRYDALRTATVNPARFLGKEREFGTIAVGVRADLLLVDGNPLADLTVVRRPAGVVVRGVWLPRSRLNQMLATLVGKS